MVDTMMEYVKGLTSRLEPLIIDLDDRLNELNLDRQELESVSRLLAYVNGDVNLVGIYADQNLILENLDKVGSNKEEYKACCYLLRSEDENVKSLPQYEQANLYVLNLINYFKLLKSELTVVIQDLEKVCQEKKLEKKYYEIFSNDNPFVYDVSEFKEFLKKHTMSDDEMINILIYTINSNILNYQGMKN